MLAKHMDLLPADVAAVVANLPGLVELRLVDCWPVTGPSLLAQPLLHARPNLQVLLHADAPAVHGDELLQRSL